jgi:hypothetical protein
MTLCAGGHEAARSFFGTTPDSAPVATVARSGAQVALEDGKTDLIPVDVLPAPVGRGERYGRDVARPVRSFVLTAFRVCCKVLSFFPLLVFDK